MSKQKTVAGVTYEVRQDNDGCRGCAVIPSSSECRALCGGVNFNPEQVPIYANWQQVKEQPIAFIPNVHEPAHAGSLETSEAEALTPPSIAFQPHNLTVPGRKDDSGKLDVTLFFDDLPHAIEAVTEVLQWAVTKKQPLPYRRGSWQGVEDFSRRYRGAQLRHMLNRAKAIKAGDAGEPADAETGLMELAHIATDAMFLLEMAVRKAKGLPVPEGA
jgi:hypothetical protein